jgi:uncharacterized protein YqgC (DUF456 family)
LAGGAAYAARLDRAGDIVLSPDELAGIAGRATVLVFGGASLFLNALGLPGNWVLLLLAAGYAWLSHFDRVGFGTLGVLAGIAVLGELLELVVGLAWTAKKGATKRGTLGAFLGGLGGALLASGWIPPIGALFGAFAGTFAGAYLLEYSAEKKKDAALRAGRAAFVGRIVASGIKTLCGFWMWSVLAWRLLAPR